MGKKFTIQELPSYPTLTRLFFFMPMTIATKTHASPFGIGMAGKAERSIVMMVIRIFPESIDKSSTMCFRISIFYAVKISVTQQASWISALNLMAGGASFNITTSQFPMSAAASSNAKGNRTPIGTAMPGGSDLGIRP